MIASALDDALGEAGELELDPASAAIAAAELSAACAGAPADDLPDQIRRWVGEHPHEPHTAETEQAAEAVERVRAESELRELWDEELGRRQRVAGNDRRSDRAAGALRDGRTRGAPPLVGENPVRISR